MKFAICNETFLDWPLERGFAAAAEYGYTGIELAPFTLDGRPTALSPQRRREIRQQIDAAGLEMVGLHWLLAKTEGIHLTSPDAAVRRRTTEYLGQLAQLCSDLGGRVLVLGSPQQRNIPAGVTHAEAMDYAADVLLGSVAALEACDVQLALEPLGPQETNFMVTTAETLELIERIAAPRIRLHLDCKAMSSETAPIPELLHHYAQWMAHFHANDPNRQGPGFGQLDFVPIFRALKEIDYRGWVSVEVFDYTPGVERLAQESLDYMRRCQSVL